MVQTASTMMLPLCNIKWRPGNEPDYFRH